SVIGRYILGPEVLEHLERGEKGAGNEIQLTDAIAATIGRVEFRGLRFSGDRFDCGSKAGFVAANVAYALARSDIPDDFKVLLKSLI
ncbi:MAG: UTP--glucose-1-phosphate uridylyltransferase, partial [Rhodospirillaceae bacterium]|nr:UTP--glucose-1-phosphate uridylyltransferase [Rhodospirillaceae bacterium]